MINGMIKGFDVSHHQGAFDFGKMAAQGHKFCFLKATEGTHFVDSQFKRSWDEAPRAGLYVGAYHFYRPQYEPAEQAAHFLKTVGPSRVGDLPCVLDLETTDHVRNGIIIAGALKWLQLVSSATGKDAIIYASPGFLKPLGDLEQFQKYPLWIANYGVNHPHVPAPWPNYTFWQYTDQHGLDLNVFNGDVTKLMALAKVI